MKMIYLLNENDNKFGEKKWYTDWNLNMNFTIQDIIYVCITSVS